MQEKQNNFALVWFQNNLRVQDNALLYEAVKKHKNIIAVYCFDPRHYENSSFGFLKTGKFRTKFLIETVTNLKNNLKTLNIELLVFNEKPETAIKGITEKYQVVALYLQKEWTSEEVQTFNNVVKELPKSIKIHAAYDQFLYHPDDINYSAREIPKVFTNFRKNTEKTSTVRPVIKIEPLKTNAVVENKTKIPTLKTLGYADFEMNPNTAFPFSGGETAALERLEYYVFKTKKLGVYKKTRNGLLGKDFSSKFSPWLANGSLSARTIFWAVKEFEKQHFKNQSTYWLVFELIWRDYFKYISLKHNNNIFKIDGILNNKYHWERNQDLVEKWINGETESNFVNANMIELKKTGWMSNRGRQNVASYFSKDLKLDWRIGAAYFESLLIDYDVHSNYGNWMYVSGVGNDPRDRKFNVNLQAQRYDASGTYQKLWLQPTLF